MPRHMKLLSTIALPLMFTINLPAQTSVVIPNANATSAAGPDGNFPSTPGSGELQTVYDPSQFPSGPFYITGLSLRAAPGPGAFSISLSGSIYLSTSPNWPNSNNGQTLAEHHLSEQRRAG
jgi:hypothetical protein